MKFKAVVLLAAILAFTVSSFAGDEEKDLFFRAAHPALDLSVIKTDFGHLGTKDGFSVRFNHVGVLLAYQDDGLFGNTKRALVIGDLDLAVDVMNFTDKHQIKVSDFEAALMRFIWSSGYRLGSDLTVAWGEIERERIDHENVNLHAALPVLRVRIGSSDFLKGGFGQNFRLRVTGKVMYASTSAYGDDGKGVATMRNLVAQAHPDCASCSARDYEGNEASVTGVEEWGMGTVYGGEVEFFNALYASGMIRTTRSDGQKMGLEDQKGERGIGIDHTIKSKKIRVDLDLGKVIGPLTDEQFYVYAKYSDIGRTQDSHGLMGERQISPSVRFDDVRSKRKEFGVRWVLPKRLF